MIIKFLWHLIGDYFFAVRKHIEAFVFPNSPDRYMKNAEAGKRPVILIPGVFEKWNFIKDVADELSARGHPIYVLDNNLGYNTKDIPGTAKLVRNLIDDKDLKDVVILAHSKGGLIGKYALAFYNKNERIKKMIAVATPFGGSKIVRFFPYKVLNRSPISNDIKLLQEKGDVNDKITSIFGVFDNHVWPLDSCRLEGAKNIQLNIFGHHKILANKDVIRIVTDEVAEL